MQTTRSFWVRVVDALTAPRGQLNMPPRNSWAIFIQVTFFTVVLLGLVVPLMFSLFFHLATGAEINEILREFFRGWKGILLILVGLLSGFGSAYAYNPIQISVPFQDRETFLFRVNVALAYVEYKPQFQSENHLILNTSILLIPLRNRMILVQIEQNSATIVGPRTHVKFLEGFIQRSVP